MRLRNSRFELRARPVTNHARACPDRQPASRRTSSNSANSPAGLAASNSRSSSPAFAIRPPLRERKFAAAIECMRLRLKASNPRAAAQLVLSGFAGAEPACFHGNCSRTKLLIGRRVRQCVPDTAASWQRVRCRHRGDAASCSGAREPLIDNHASLISGTPGREGRSAASGASRLLKCPLRRRARPSDPAFVDSHAVSANP